MAFTGPCLRGCGIEYDVRRAQPYSIYDRFDFDIPIGLDGDCWDRHWVRVQEMYESLKIIEQALEQMPGGEVRIFPGTPPDPPTGRRSLHEGGEPPRRDWCPPDQQWH